MINRLPKCVVPAKAGTHLSAARMLAWWLPAFAGMTFLLLGFSAPVAAADRISDRKILHILDRLAFGPSAADVKHIKALGIDRYIAEQLDPASISQPSALTSRLAAPQTLQLAPAQLFPGHCPLRRPHGAQPCPEDQ